MTHSKIVPAMVSVIVPTYNRSSMVQRAVASVLSQDYRKLEAVVIDDRSEDNTSAVIHSMRAHDSRVVYSRNAESKGCAGARNTGLKIARGRYVSFLDDDDLFLPGKIRSQVAWMEDNPGTDVLVDGVRKQWCTRGNDGLAWLGLELAPNLIFDGCQLMVRRKSLDGIRLRCNYMEWRDFAFQAYMNGLRVHLAERQLVRKNNTEQSLSKRTEEMLTTALDNAREYCERTIGRPEHDVFRRYLANCEKSVANFSLKRGRLAKAAIGYRKAFRAYPDPRNLVPFA